MAHSLRSDAVDPDAGKDWWQEENRGQQRMRWLDGITDSMDINLNKLRDIVKNRAFGLTVPTLKIAMLAWRPSSSTLLI